MPRAKILGRFVPGMYHDWSMVVRMNAFHQEHFGHGLSRPGDSIQSFMSAAQATVARELGHQWFDVVAFETKPRT